MNCCFRLAALHNCPFYLGRRHLLRLPVSPMNNIIATTTVRAHAYSISYSAAVHMHDYYSHGGFVSDVHLMIQMVSRRAGITKKLRICLTTFNEGSVVQVQQVSFELCLL